MTRRPLRVLFVIDRTDAPYRYRCVHAVEQLRASGALAHVARAADPRVPASVAAYSVVVLVRLPWGADVQGVVEAARQAGVPLVFDCDDLVFDPGAAALLPASAERAVLAALRRTFDVCDLFVGSTPTLAQWATRLGKPAAVHRNVAPREYVKLEPWVRRARPRFLSVPTIGYFAGSNTHDADFESVAPALRAVLLGHESARLLVGGHVDTGVSLRGLEGRVVRIPHISWRVLPWAYAACHVTIAPISVVNAFADGKSALKFFEPALFGVPVVATPIAEMRLAIDHGVTGWLAEDEASWVAALDAALDRAKCRGVAEAAVRAAFGAHTESAVEGRLAALLEEVAVPASGPEPAKLFVDPEEYDGRADPISRAGARVRRARDLALVVAALREPVGTGPALDAADAYVAGLLAGAPAGPPAPILRDPESSGWHPASQIAGSASCLGEVDSTGTDPYYASPLVDLGSRPLRYAILRMRASTATGRGSGQLFWLSGRRGTFAEEKSALFSVIADGTDTTYVLDLWKSRDAALWRGRPGALRLRLDPIDRAGSFRVLALAFVADDPSFDAAVPALEVKRLGRRRRSARRALRRRTRRLGVGERAWVAVDRDATWTRRLLARELGGLGAVVERLEATPDGTRALVVRTAVERLPGVDIVVPVFNAREQTLRCLGSVIRHARGDYRLVVIDDASTDPELRPALEAFAAKHDRVVLLANAGNLGFVRTCNRAMDLAGDRDVLLLNSDTRVFRGFLNRLRACAYADDTTGIVCPFSNNATILSAPDFCRPNTLPEGMSDRQMATLVARTSRRRRPEIVTPVGFCMYIRTEVLSAVGHFDAEHFGRGFGEENDLGERAKAAGFKIRLADDVYVWHEGKASFGEGGYELEARNAPVLEARQPGYHAAVARFIEENPLAPLHEELRYGQARWLRARTPAVMMLLHASPFREPCGGTEYIVRDLVRGLALPRVVIAYPGETSVEVAEVIDGAWERASHHRFALAEPVPRFCHEHAEAERVLRHVLELFRVGHVHVHHLMNWPLSVARVLERARRPWSVTVHDFYCVCPSQNLLDPAHNRRCCPASIGDAAQTGACMRSLFTQLALAPPDDPPAFVDDHRALFRRCLDVADHVVFPSESARRIVESVYGVTADRAVVLPHAYVPAPAGVRAGPTAPGTRLRVALIGEVSYPSKGADGYLDVMQRLATEDVEWHIFGETARFDFEARLARLDLGARVVRHGAYARDDIVGRLQEAGVDVGLLLPIWPETFSLTLSELLAAGVPVIAAAQGALADRLHDVASGVLVESASEAAATLRDMSRDPALLARFRAAARKTPSPDVAAWLAAHRELYARSSPRVRTGKLKRRELRALLASRVRSPQAETTISTVQAAARFRSSTWYQRAERLKPYIPESVRALVRQRLADRRWRPLQRFRLPGRHAALGAGARVDARYLTTARLTSLGDDPHFVLELDPVDAADVGAIRFNVWCSHHGHTFAQIYWQHDGDAGFTEDKSLVVELDGRLGDWQEYVVQVDRKTYPGWYAGKSIVGLRFDPVNYAGLFCVGQLALCAPELAVPRRRFPLLSG